MALQTFDFDKRPGVTKGYGDIFKNILQGYKGSRLPYELRQKEEENQLGNERARLANSMQQAREPYAGQYAANEAGLQEAQRANLERQAKFGHLTGPAAEAQSLESLRETNPKAAALAERLISMREQSQKSLIKSRESVNDLRMFNTLPAKEKASVLAKLRAVGVSEYDALEGIKNGITPEEMAERKGVNREEFANIEPHFLPGEGTLKDIKTTEGAMAEEDYLNPLISEALAPYSQTFMGYSPEQIADSFSEEPEAVDRHAKALAARALTPEVAGIRSRIAGGSSAHEALKEITHLSLNQLKVLGASVRPEVYEKAQKYIHEWNKGAGEARIKALKTPGLSKSASSNASEKVKLRNPKTGEIKEFSMEEAVKRGYKRK
jgi:hypothetical protein